jgi:DNA-binding response OmpR family regulator
LLELEQVCHKRLRIIGMVNQQMHVATTIVFARADLSIPGAAVHDDAERDGPGTAEARFFELIARSRPDVIVLDFSHSVGAEADTIGSIKRKTGLPVLVICDPAAPKMEQYRMAGAADCIAAPIDIMGLNRAIQQIMRAGGNAPLLPHLDTQRALADLPRHGA